MKLSRVVLGVSLYCGTSCWTPDMTPTDSGRKAAEVAYLAKVPGSSGGSQDALTRSNKYQGPIYPSIMTIIQLYTILVTESPSLSLKTPSPVS
ncbi:hypothetical protein BDV59DRAFT_18308 [Aspergillus ambiguus]|uniref:uncharacterized protein n=1 Tax=Aspergillus ambiguus TaxID=176160 RepID=UPI003CCDB6AA